MAKLPWIAAAAATAVLLAAQQRTDFRGEIEKRNQALPVIAVPDFRGSGDAQPLAAAFNQTLWSDLESSGKVQLAPKTMYPTVVPQQPSDLLEPRPDVQKAGGRLLSDWSNPPAQANYLAFGYAASKEGLFVAFGYFYDLSQPVQTAKVIGEIYTAPLNEDGARKAAHEFAAAILARFGGTTLFGTHIYFTSNRSGHKEIWAMDFDGSNQRQITHFNFIATSPAVSPDGSRLMCTAWPGEGKQARIFLFSTDPLRQLTFVSPPGMTYTAHSSFTPDGKQALFDGATGDSYRIFISGIDGSHPRVIRSSESVEVQPVMNPKNPNVIAFTSGRSGTPQIYTMDADGGSLTRVTNGNGEAHNAAWQPDGAHIAFAWTQGYAPGNLNIFIVNVADGSYVQLTHGEGKNENPSWAPDGVHLAFSSTRMGGREQIWSMRADGQDLKQLTTEGTNSTPAWGK